VGINGKSLRGQNLNFAVDQIAGPINTPIYLTVVRNGRQLSPMTLTRREVKILSVSEVQNCPISRLLAAAEIKLEAKLV
jgi:C-terminal processing protease CtpA/Prc